MSRKIEEYHLLNEVLLEQYNLEKKNHLFLSMEQHVINMKYISLSITSFIELSDTERCISSSKQLV